jgi:hypothetical protein
MQKIKKKREISRFNIMAVSSILSWEGFFVRAFNAIVHKVTANIAAATEMRAALLNSGTLGLVKRALAYVLKSFLDLI